MENMKRFIFQMAVFTVLTVIYVTVLFAYSASDAPAAKVHAGFSMQDKLIEKTFDVTPGGTFSLTTNQGAIHVEGWDRPEVKVRIEFSGQERYFDDISVTMNENPTGIDVKVEVPRETFRLFGSSPRVRLSFSVMTPREYNVNVRTAGGSVSVSGIDGDIKGNTSGGSIRAEELSGTIDLRTSGGSVRSSGVNGKISLKTSGGGITVENASGILDVKTSGGRIDLKEVDAMVEASTSGGGIELSLAGENRGISLRTSGGGIKVVLPENITANLSARTSGGGVSSDLPVMVQGSVGKTSLEGTINGGGPDITLRTSGGSIRIQSR
jgi:DUF4097 and DUF4098 domain-containing protein YvlB